MSGLSYRQSGVDIDAADAFVERIKPLAAGTRGPNVMAGVGGFAGLYRMPTGLSEPILVSGTDGVGTKLKVALALATHDTIGIDLVAMCVNDVITTGAQPLFFLDYLATGALNVDQATDVVRGIAAGCTQAGCALLGGETAEMPGFYAAGEYDVAGFAVGVVERSALVDGRRVQAGDRVVGVASSGLHSNGYSLARKALLEPGTLDLRAPHPKLGAPLGQVLLTPTRIYARAVAAALGAGDVRAICHVTGGGIPGNLPRVLPAGVRAEVRRESIPDQPIFALIQEAGEVADAEMWRTFNMGVGLLLVVPATDAGAVIAALTSTGETAFLAGIIRPQTDPDAPATVELVEE